MRRRVGIIMYGVSLTIEGEYYGGHSGGMYEPPDGAEFLVDAVWHEGEDIIELVEDKLDALALLALERIDEERESAAERLRKRRLEEGF